MLQLNNDLINNKVPESIVKLIQDSEAFKNAISTIEANGKQFNDRLDSSLTEAKNMIAEEMRKFQKLKEEFSALTKDTFNSKANNLITQAYEKNANSHQCKEIIFQIICGLSITGAITILLLWLLGWINSPIEQNSDYYWLPIATITSLFLFLARWAAKIAYRYGLESRRLNQYALDLSTMPAYFYQPLLTGEDEKFKSVGKEIITEKSRKMFGNINRFDEQHSHSLLELTWKWIIKKDEGKLIEQHETKTPNDG